MSTTAELYHTTNPGVKVIFTALPGAWLLEVDCMGRLNVKEHAINGHCDAVVPYLCSWSYCEKFMET